MLKDAIIAAIAEMYSTTVHEVRQDIAAQSHAQEALDQFCQAIEDAGY